MKPRGEKQKRLCEWAGMLPPLDEKRKEWAKGLFPAQAKYYSRRGNNCDFWCQCCGAIVPTLGKWLLVDHAADKWTCPECGAECEVLPQYSGGFSHDRNPRTGERSVPSDDVKQVTLVDVFRGVQVFRTFMVYRFNYRDGIDENGRWRTKPTEYAFDEVFQNWVLEDASEVITARRYSRNIYSVNWNMSSEWTIQRHNSSCTGYYAFEDMFDLTGTYIFPGHKVTPLLKRNGWSERYFPEGANPVKLARNLLGGDAKYETLTKARQKDVVMYLLNHENVDIQDYWPSLKICLRNNYRIKDASMWFDYIYDLMILGLDVHNAHYVCPPDLRKAHQEMGKRREKLVKKNKDREDYLEAMAWDERYKKEKAPFIGLAFGDKKVNIHVLGSTKEVWDEAQSMHHCVIRNKYYKQSESLLLSARNVRTGDRLETIEISLRSFTVLQSRGLQNCFTNEHQHILDLCRENMPMLKMAAARVSAKCNKQQ